jgi:hypothetical protein
MMADDMRGLLTLRLSEEGMPEEVPISVAELHRRLLPYGLCRERLGFASKAEYDVDLLRLLVDEDSLQVPEAALVEAARRELASPEPGLALLERFAASEVRLRARADCVSASEAVTQATTNEAPIEAGPIETGPPIADLETGRSRGDFLPGLDDPLLVPQDESAEALGRVGVPDAGPAGEVISRSGGSCRSCREPLPARAGVRYCTTCGADQERWPCPSCGEEVERGWSYCALCGKMLRT